MFITFLSIVLSACFFYQTISDTDKECEKDDFLFEVSVAGYQASLSADLNHRHIFLSVLFIFIFYFYGKHHEVQQL